MSASTVTSTAHVTSPERSVPARPLPQIVPRSADAPVADVTGGSSQEGDVGRWAAIGAVIGFTVGTVAITLAGVVGGLGFASSLGLGLFLGFWGGAGFGSMMGITIPLARHAEAVELGRGRG